MEYGSIVVNKRGIIGRICGHPTPNGEIVVMHAREHYPAKYHKITELRLATIDDAKQDYARTVNRDSKRVIRSFARDLLQTA